MTINDIKEWRKSVHHKDAGDMVTIIDTLLEEVERLKLICRNAGIGDYKANYLGGKPTELGELREKLFIATEALMRIEQLQYYIVSIKESKEIAAQALKEVEG